MKCIAPCFRRSESLARDCFSWLKSRAKDSLLQISIVLCLFVSTAHASQNELSIVISDLQKTSQLAKARNVPIMILFSIEDCEFCEIVREEYLQPMQNREEDRSRIIIGEISIEDYNTVRDFNGKSVGADVLGMRYSADFSPTVVFIDFKGKELVKRIVGFKGHDYYGYALNSAINQSIKKLSQFSQ